MAGLISDETLELVDKISVISLAERLGYRMKRAGTWLQIECPNCGDSKCYIGNRKGYFVCYDGGGCGAKGYIKDFLLGIRTMKNLTPKNTYVIRY